MPKLFWYLKDGQLSWQFGFRGVDEHQACEALQKQGFTVLGVADVCSAPVNDQILFGGELN